MGGIYIEIDLTAIGLEGVKLIHLTQAWCKWRALVSRERTIDFGNSERF